MNLENLQVFETYNLQFLETHDMITKAQNDFDCQNQVFSDEVSTYLSENGSIMYQFLKQAFPTKDIAISYNKLFIPTNEVIDGFIEFLADKTIKTLTLNDIDFELLTSIIKNHVGYNHNNNTFKSENDRQWRLHYSKNEGKDQSKNMIDIVPIISKKSIHSRIKTFTIFLINGILATSLQLNTLIEKLQIKFNVLPSRNYTETQLTGLKDTDLYILQFLKYEDICRTCQINKLFTQYGIIMNFGEQNY